MKINKLNIVTIFLTFFNIFFSIPFLIINILKKKDVSFPFALILAILAFFFRPATTEYDIYRYYELFTDAGKRIDMFSYQKDIYAEYMVKFLMYYNLPKYFLAFTSAFITYFFLFKCFYITSNKKYSILNYFLIFVLAYIRIPIIGYTGIRFFPAVAVFCYGIINKKKIINIIFPIVSIFIHTSLLIPYFIYFVSNYILKIKFSLEMKRILIIFSFLLGFLLKPEVLANIIMLFNKLGLFYVSPGYILGKWGIDYLSLRRNLIALIINNIIIYIKISIILGYSFFIVKKKETNFIFLFSCFTLVLYRYYVFFGRYSGIIIIIIFYKIQDKILLKNKVYNFLGILLVLNSLIILLYDLKWHYVSFLLSYSNPLKLSLLKIILDIF